MDPLRSSDSIKWCAHTKELTFLRSLGSELGGKAPQTDTVEWQWNQITFLVYRPSTSFPNLFIFLFYFTVRASV